MFQIIHKSILAGLFLFLIITSSEAGAQNSTEPPVTFSSPDMVVLSVGDTMVTAREVERILQTMPPQFRPYYSGPGRRVLADVIVKNKILTKEAEKRRLLENNSVQLDMKISKESILSAAASRELEKEFAVTQEEAQKFLDEHVSQFEEVRARRIVIRSTSSIPYDTGAHVDKPLSDQEAKAKAEGLRKKLVEGEDFEELAAKFSQDSMSSGRGGDLGFIRRGNKIHLIAPPLEERIFSSKPGTLTDVMQTPLGFEIVRIEEKRIPKIGDLRKEIDPLIRGQKIDGWVNAKKQEQPVKIDEEYFKSTAVSAVQGIHK